MLFDYVCYVFTWEALFCDCDIAGKVFVMFLFWSGNPTLRVN